MSCVVSDKNWKCFDVNSIIPIIPRTVSFSKRIELMKDSIWIAVGLDEFNQIILANDSFRDEVYICVDIANGHMKRLLELCKFAKEKFGDKLVLMAGNIANPDVYLEYAKAGVDYIRCCVGSGGACATNDITAIGYNPVELLRACVNYKQFVKDSKELLFKDTYLSVPKIVLDGGCSSIRDIIVALALGADYVMCGKIFAKAEEAAGEIIDQKIDTPYSIATSVRGRMYYGMSTERAQREMGNKVIKHSEGKEMFVPIEYTLKDWTSQFVAGISSTMSYCNTPMLTDFIGKVKLNKK